MFYLLSNIFWTKIKSRNRQLKAWMLYHFTCFSTDERDHERYWYLQLFNNCIFPCASFILISYFINILVAPLINKVIKQLMTEQLITFVCLSLPWKSLKISGWYFHFHRHTPPYIKKLKEYILCLKRNLLTILLP